jgi:Sec-independent protein secretion pathway component TatC
MSRLTSSLVAAAVIGQLLGLLGWIDPLFIPLVLLGPVITGAVAAARRMSYSWVAVAWTSAGLTMLWTDWVINHEDVLFHLALSLLMTLLAGLGFGAVKLTGRSRTSARAPL